MKQNRSFALLIFGVIIILYAKTIGFDFSYMDDNQILLNNQSAFESVDIKKMVTTDPFLLQNNTFLYRPLQSLSFLADTLISGGVHPWMLHLTNIILFGLIGGLLFLILLKFNISRKVAFVGTLLFCVHPLFVTAVAWIPARGDLLLTLLTMLATICLLEFTQTGKIKHLLFVWISFTFALFCKETAVFLPIVLLVYLITMAPNRKNFIPIVLLFLSMGLSMVVWFYIRTVYIPPIATISMSSFCSHLFTIPISFAKIILFPIDFSPLPTYTTTKIVVGCLFCVFLIYFVCKNNKRTHREILFYFLWFLLFLIPNFLGEKLGVIDYIDNRFLLPMIGILLFVLSLFPPSSTESDPISFSVRKDGIWMGSVALLCIVSLFKTEVYRNPESYYGTVLKQNPKNAVAYNNRGLVRFVQDDLSGALEDFTQAIQYDKGHIRAYHNRGTLKFGLGDLKGAMEDLDMAILLDSTHFQAYVDRAVTKGMMGNIYGAIDDINIALSIQPNLKEAYFNRAIAYYTLREYEKAIQDIEKVLEIAPSNEDAIQLKNIILKENEEK